MNLQNFVSVRVSGTILLWIVRSEWSLRVKIICDDKITLASVYLLRSELCVRCIEYAVDLNSRRTQVLTIVFRTTLQIGILSF